MVWSILNHQRDVILNAIRQATNGDWKVLVLDAESRRLVENVAKEDDILNENITHIEQIEERRAANPDTDAVYLLSTQPHIVDCLLADLSRRRYRSSHLLWTSFLDPRLRRRIDSERAAQDQVTGFSSLSINYFPRESHLVIFRDPWSFPVLFHPGCSSLVRGHLQEIAEKALSLCVSLGDYPIVRYYRPREATHEASVLCSHLARTIQEELDAYAQYHPEFTPQPGRPRSVMYVTDRSMDLYSPLVHEFTYQAMVHDLLPIQDTGKVYYRTVMNAGEPTQKEKDMEIGESDKIWTENRHRHMKDTIEKLMGDFKKFIDDNPHFATTSSDKPTSLNAIRDMLAGLPQFQELKEAYSLHLSMAQECMNIFQSHKLADLASVEQSLATGLDEEYRKPKNLAEQVVRLADDGSVVPHDRLRLIMLYILYRNGLVPGDTHKLLAHAQLSQREHGIIDSMALLGARVQKPLKDSKPAPAPLFGRKAAPPKDAGEEYGLSRFSPALKLLLEQHVAGTLDPTIFPYTKPPPAASDGSGGGGLGSDVDGPCAGSTVSQTSLRSAKPTWAKSRWAAGGASGTGGAGAGAGSAAASAEPRQRVIVLMAGGATYAESRACYEVSYSGARDVLLVTSHMQSPGLFLRQLADLGVDRRKLDIPADRPPLQPPSHLFEPVPPPPSQAQAAAASASASGGGGGGGRHPGSGGGGGSAGATATAAALGAMRLTSGSGAANGREASPSGHSASASHAGRGEKDEKQKKKKKHHFFSSKK